MKIGSKMDLKIMQFTLTEDEFAESKRIKGSDTWRKFFLRMVKHEGARIPVKGERDNERELSS